MATKQTKSKTIRFPVELIERITILANKGHRNFSKWVIMTCERESKPRK